ncbi:TetR/AcrR family transcriptional regulator [Paragemmobacter ruber]|uniref:TetR/AcrR family transcriptional regulator n=1 Tax=Paragemmobacter ruber TaxID=1985673 RepID=A0ABW9YAQ1_9RHOB|nr:TetR/AcrR family transcriptional regulator [Rhodobacter ruber]NBE09101.1 TetR/AcrR family transcriptional regulator [Rhodobacter ruber]
MTAGRPTTPRLTQDAILTEALALLDQSETALTIRALAARMNVTPMAIQHHIGTRDALIHSLADRTYRGVTGTTIRELLTAYTATIRRHPTLTLALFRIPGPLPIGAQRITDTLDALLRQTLPEAKAKLWRDILIDWAHGMALAQAPEDPRPALDALLGALSPGCNARP